MRSISIRPCLINRSDVVIHRTGLTVIEGEGDATDHFALNIGAGIELAVR